MTTVRASIDRHVERLRAARGPRDGDDLRRRMNNRGLRAAGTLAVGLNAILGDRSREKLGILTYHRVAPEVAGLPFPLHNVTPAAFRSQLEGLLRRGFHFAPLDEALAVAANGGRFAPKTIVVTFDDGFRSVYENAWPVLKELKISATIFLTTSYLDRNGPFWFDAWGRAFEGRVPSESYEPLTTAQCREMAESGVISFGAHTQTHEDFRGRPEEFAEEVAQSAAIVQELFNVEHVPFAFPFGSRHLGFAGPGLCEAARETGVTCGLTTEAASVERGADPFKWGRFNVFSWDTAATLAAKLGGWYGWAPRIRQKLGSALRGGRKRTKGDRNPLRTKTLHTRNEELSSLKGR